MRLNHATPIGTAKTMTVPLRSAWLAGLVGVALLAIACRVEQTEFEGPPSFEQGGTGAETATGGRGSGASGSSTGGTMAGGAPTGGSSGSAAGGSAGSGGAAGASGGAGGGCPVDQRACGCERVVCRIADGEVCERGRCDAMDDFGAESYAVDETAYYWLSRRGTTDTLNRLAHTSETPEVIATHPGTNIRTLGTMPDDGNVPLPHRRTERGRRWISDALPENRRTAERLSDDPCPVGGIGSGLW